MIRQHGRLVTSLIIRRLRNSPYAEIEFKFSFWTHRQSAFDKKKIIE